MDVSEKYIETIEKKTWLNQTITPYELYLKFLYEYFKEEINQTDELDLHSRPDNFREFEYQKHAVLNAKKLSMSMVGFSSLMWLVLERPICELCSLKWQDLELLCLPHRDFLMKKILEAGQMHSKIFDSVQKIICVSLLGRLIKCLSGMISIVLI